MGIRVSLANIRVIVNYLKSDIVKKQRSFKIGLLSIFLVVFFVSLLMSTISLFPTIFLRISEDQVGETDIIMLPFLNKEDISKRPSSFDRLLFNLTKNHTGIPGLSDFQFTFLNFEELHQQLKNEPYIRGVMPRWIMQANTTANKLWAVSNVMIINSHLENKYGMGRNLQLTELKALDCYVSNSLYKSLKLNLNESRNIEMKVRFTSFLKAVGNFDVLENTQAKKTNEDDYQSMINFIPTIDRHNQSPKVITNFDSIIAEYSKYNDDFFINETRVINITIQNQSTIYQNEIKLLKSFLLNIRELNQVTFKINTTEIYNWLSLHYGISQDQFTDNEISLSFLFNSPFTKNLPIIKRFKEFLTKDNDDLFKSIFHYDNQTEKLRLSTQNNVTYININITRLILSISDEKLDEDLTFKLNLTIKDVVPSTSGKWPPALGNVIAIDSQFGKGYISHNLINMLSKIVKTSYKIEFLDSVIEECVYTLLKDFSLEKYALTVNGLIEDKFDVYKGTQTKHRQEISKLTGRLIKKLGYDYPVKMELPLYETFKGVEIGKVFLENICNAVMFFLWILSLLLIYSLMLGNVDERTYEFGMLRSLGYLKSNLITMIIFHAFIFSVPAVFLAIVSCYVVNIIISYYLFGYSGLLAPFYLSKSTIFWSVAFGLSIPLVSSYLPIKKALSENLKDALAIFNKKIGDLFVNIVKLDSLGISPSALLSSIILIAIGFATYYISPLSYFLMDYSIFILIMTLILMVMLLGLIIILQLLTPKLQALILNLIMLFAYKDRNIHFVVIKNLAGHSRRNQQTSIMFMIALSFTIFAGCTLNLVVDFIASVSKTYFGGDIWIWQHGNNENQQTLNQNRLSAYLEKKKVSFPGLIKNYSFISYPLDEILQRETRFASLSGFPDKRTDIVAVDKNLISSGFSELYMFSDYDKNLNFSRIDEIDNVDIISGLYSNNNIQKVFPVKKRGIEYPSSESKEESIYIYIFISSRKDYLDMELRMIIPQGLKRSFAVDLENPCSVKINMYPHQTIPCRVIALAIKIPGISFYSSYSTISWKAPVLISMEQMKELVHKEMNIDEDIYNKLINTDAFSQTPDGIRKKYLIIKFYDDIPLDMKEMVYFEIKNIINYDNTFTILVDDITHAAKKAGKIMEIFFIVIGIIALVLSFFLIWTSFYSNIKDNICEYGIMRSIGINTQQSIRIYLYEAFAIITSSIILGTAIGVIISSTLILQFNLFTELPFQPNFPIKLYTILVLFGLCLGLLGSYYPTHEVNKLALVKIMKGLVG